MTDHPCDYEKAIAKNEVIQSTREQALAVLQPDEKQLEYGLQLHADSIVCDAFGFLPNVWTAELVEEMNALLDGQVGAKEHHFRTNQLRATAAMRNEAAAHEYIAALKAAGLSCTMQTSAEGKTRERDIKRIASFHGICHAFAGHMLLGAWADDVAAAKERDRICVFLSVNGPPCPGAMIDRDEELGWIETWHHLGVRMMHLTYNRRNIVGDGCMEDANGGLSEFGKELIGELNEAGIIVDTSHSGEQTTLDAAHFSEKPMVASHSGCRALQDHPRNKTDEVIKAIADSGGLLGICNLPGFLGGDENLNALLDHIDYAVKLVGPEHVTIGTDICYVPPWPEGLRGYQDARWTSSWWGAWKPEYPSSSSNDHREGSLAWTNWPIFTVGLVMRGYSDDDIRRIIGGNLLRVLAANEPPHIVSL